MTLALAAGAESSESLRLSGRDGERFLKTAEVVAKEKVAVGITRPQRLTLTDGQLTLDAVWKTVEIFSPRQKMADGRIQLSFRDTYRSEIAAYKLSELLGLGMVPPTIERKIDRQRGSLQLWLDQCMTERERKERGLHAPDLPAWNRQMATVRLFHQLIHDIDYNNINNILISEDFRIWIIDSSRGFYLNRELRNEDALTRFSRSLLDRLRSIDNDQLKSAMGTWLSRAQIEALLIRRDRILELAQRRVAERGEEAVLFP